jgi:uncharacterized membrane protein YczE
VSTLARTAPAPSRWRASPGRLAQLLLGLWLYGVGDALVVLGGLGNSPWTILSEGVGERTGTTIGMATFLIGVVVLLAWIPLRERPGLGTVLNVVVVSLAIDVTVWLLPAPEGLVLRGLALLAGVAVVGIASGLYLGVALGPGPRDGWMTGLHRRTGVALWLVRLGIEGAVVLTGWLLGGTVGIGTIVYAALIGPAVDLSIRLLRPRP